MPKKKGSRGASKTLPAAENALPQNILPVGERVEEDKNIYIAQPVYKEIHRFTENKTTNESGGLLIGGIIEAFGKTNIIIRGFIEAKYCEATPTTLKFTHETWEYCHKEMEKRFPGQSIVGWIHTHPDFGIFLSEYDKFIQENFFKEAYQIAYVVDPIQKIEGFYFWINGKIERCKGFYIFDKTGAKISVGDDKADSGQGAGSRPAGFFRLQNVVIGLLAVCTLLLLFAHLSQNAKLEDLQKQQEALMSSANQSLAYLQQQISDLLSRVEGLEKAAEAAEEPADTSETTSEITSGTAGETASENAGASCVPSAGAAGETTSEAPVSEESSSDEPQVDTSSAPSEPGLSSGAAEGGANG